MIEPTPGTGSQPSRGLGPIVVLLVDDQAFIGSVVGQMLESEPDIELHCCLSALNAISVANEISPAVILQDLIMPDIDGLTLVRAYRSNPQTAATPIVVLSGNDDAATRARALSEGAQDYLVKLPPKADLIACIRRCAEPGAAEDRTLDPATIDRFKEAGAPDFTCRLIDQFSAEVATRVQSLHEAAGENDDEALKMIAHSLKGSSMVMGATRLAVLCAKVETALTTAPGAGITPALLSDIDQELARLQAALSVQKDEIGQG
jgi:PleD family two-component response regulator